MKITLQHQAGMHFIANDEAGNKVNLDGKGKEGLGPFNMLIAAVGGCSGIDMVAILEKMRQQPENIRIEVEAEKEELESHKEWRKIHLTFFVSGEVELDKAQRAAELSVTKYCSVSKMMEPQAEITYSVELE